MNEFKEWERKEERAKQIRAYFAVYSELPTLRPAAAMALAKAKIAPKKMTRGEGVINRKEHGRK